MIMKNFTFLFLAVLILTLNILAQQTSLAPVPTAKKTEAPAKTLIKIPITVEAEDGAFWNEGKRQSFKIFLDETEAPIKNFQAPQSSTILFVVFDTVADITRVDEARSALQESLSNLNEQYWVALIRAQDGLSVLQEPTADRKLLNEKIHSIQVTGKAGLLDTLEPISEIATAMLQKAAVRLAVLYITDSGIANYRADYLNPVINSSDSGDLSRRFSDRAVQERISRLSESLSRFTVPIYVLHLAQRGDALNLAYQSGLERIAADSGGAALLCRTNDEIRPGLETLMNRIRASYLVAVEQPNTKRQAVKIRVEAQDATGKAFEHVSSISQISIKKKK